VRQRREKRPFVAVAEARLPEELRRCQVVLAALMRSKNAQPFLQPVDAEALGTPDYYNIIKHPMDLGTVSVRLAGGHYDTLNEVTADVALVWDNCRQYNGPSHPYSKWADELQESFDDKMAPLLQRYSEEERERRQVEQQSKRFRKEIEALEAQINELKGLPTPKTAAAPEQPLPQEITKEEKQRLRRLLVTMDPITTAKVFDFLQRDCPNAMVEKEEDVEIDLDALDIRGFRALDRLLGIGARRQDALQGRKPPKQEGAGRGRPRLQPSPHQPPPPPVKPRAPMPAGFEELPDEGVFGPATPHTCDEAAYSDEEDDGPVGPSPAGHIRLAADRAGLEAESENEEGG
jgi:hypothetical protein